MATFLTGHTFGSTEQVTNTKLNNVVNLASISGIKQSEFLSDIGSYSTNASLIDVANVTSLNLFYSTYGSLATFINARVGQRLTLVAQQASFPTVVDTGAFKLSANWFPASQYDNLSLIWDGSAFIEVGRTSI